MFDIVRYIIGITIFIFFLLYNNRHKVAKKRLLNIIAFIISNMVIVVLSFLPIENVFITFKSVESAFSYVYNGEIQTVIDGKDTAMVVAKNNDTDVIALVPKYGDNWKIGIRADIRRQDRQYDNIYVDIYQYKDTNDYYISVFDINGGETVISDSNNSKFYSVSDRYDINNKPIYVYYCYINNLDMENYTLTINNKDIYINS